MEIVDEAFCHIKFMLSPVSVRNLVVPDFTIFLFH